MDCRRVGLILILILLIPIGALVVTLALNTDRTAECPNLPVLGVEFWLGVSFSLGFLGTGLQLCIRLFFLEREDRILNNNKNAIWIYSGLSIVWIVSGLIAMKFVGNDCEAWKTIDTVQYFHFMLHGLLVLLIQ